MKKLHTKSIIAIVMIIMLTSQLTACGEETFLLTNVDYDLNLSDGVTTSKGIHIGSTPEEFLKAYNGYDIEVSTDGGAYQPLDEDEISFTDSTQTILPTFFIDDIPMTIEQICMENGIERTELLSLLSSEDYLASHEVIYRYMTFSWENGAITDIRTDYMDYNADASYYQNSED